MLQPSSSMDRGTSDVALLDEREQVVVRDLLLAVGQGDRGPVDASSCSPSTSWPSSRSLPWSPRRPDSLPIDRVLPDSPTDCGVMIS